jgi:hypothetical protein
MVYNCIPAKDRQQFIPLTELVTECVGYIAWMSTKSVIHHLYQYSMVIMIIECVYGLGKWYQRTGDDILRRKFSRYWYHPSLLLTKLS